MPVLAISRIVTAKEHTLKKYIHLLVVALALFISPPTRLHAQSTAFTYQGRLNFNGVPASGSFDLAFTLFATNSTGTALAGTFTNGATTITNGLFAVPVDFGAGVFTGQPRWLEIAARTNSSGPFITLIPRQSVTPLPYAMFANTASNLTGLLPAAQLSGLITVTQLPVTVVTNNEAGLNLIGTFTGNGASVTNVNAALLNGKSATNFWQSGGNNISAGQFLGSTNNQPLIFKANGQQVARFEPTTDTPNVIGGFSGNLIQAGLVGDTIGGGGTALGGQPNLMTNNAYYATIGGGFRNTVTNYGGAVLGGAANFNGGYFGTIGGGEFNAEQGDFSMIGGGQNNTIQVGTIYATIAGGSYGVIYASSDYGTVGGGQKNNVFNGPHGTVGGGSNNIVEAVGATVSGGLNNQAGLFTGVGTAAVVAGGMNNYASGNFSTIAGGTGNSAAGDYALAAGRRALAQDNGTFVWADSQNADFASSNTNQFLIRANNGVGINSANPVGVLNVAQTLANTNGFPALALDNRTANSSYGNWITFMDHGAPMSRIHAYGQKGGNGGIDFSIQDTASHGWFTMVDFSPGGAFIGLSTTIGGQLDVGGDVTADNMTAMTFNTTSDRNAKTNFTAVSVAATLEKVIALPVTTWNFKSDPSSLQHLGPMAQDFYAAFGLGQDDRHISTVDEAGIALAAIQGLNEKLEARSRELAEENTALKKRLEKIERQLAGQN